MSRYRATLIPKLFSHWWETLERPHRLMDQRFAIKPTHFFEPSFFDRRFPFERAITENLRSWNEFVREFQRDCENGWSVVKNDKNKFHVCLDVQQFKPDEITVKVLDDFVVVEGKFCFKTQNLT
ncbi:Protein lethal(2)essential for life [Ooceraea biroi]|uniref:Protein lethal(2)essential for life n=1 Tax=Ooceraea biroi TaxID=2015173 RepID=A0A026WQZ1_OOCBI|nr:Protein lethal(2)essential for life [Ooceraea biroi]